MLDHPVEPRQIARTSPATGGDHRTAHAGALAIFAGLTAVWLRPLIAHWGAAIPGGGAGDNVVFVWNVWWVRYALLHGLSPLHTPMLLYPFGADLTLHTLTLLPALAVAFVANPLAAQNALIAAHLFLNFTVTYALAFATTRSVAASMIAALAFGWSPYIGAHLVGHFNLIAAWVLPLAALMALGVDARPSRRRGAALGAVIGLTAYVDYYYFVYAALLAGILLYTPAVRVVPRPAVRPQWISRVVVALSAIAALAVVAAIAIAISGGGTLRAASINVSMRSAWNPAALAWLSALGAVVVWAITAIRISIDRAALAKLGRPSTTAALVMAAILSPLLVAAARLALSGGYVSQPYLWRSAPAGIDVVTLALGNPSSAAYGRLVGEAYRRIGIDAVEHVAWLSPALIVLAAFGFSASAARKWIVALGVFGVWALGPSLHAAGQASPLWLPAAALRWVPIVANARIPARAMVVVYLACAMLAGLGVERVLRSRRIVLTATMAVLLVFDLVPHPPPVTTLPHPAFLDALRNDPGAGAVLDVPFGLRDGFGETGALDPMAMWFQTIHERPIAGGFVARLPPGIAERYRALPSVGSILRLSSGERVMPAETAVDGLGPSLGAEGFRFLLVDVRLAPPAAQEYVRRVLFMTHVSGDLDYELYSVQR